MEDLDEVRNRIQKKHHQGMQKKVLGDRQFKHLYRFAMICMTVCAFGLGFASYLKKNPSAFSSMQEHFNFSWFENHILTVIPFFQPQEKEQSVSANMLYERVGEHLYQGTNNEILSLDSGIVTSLEEDTIVVSQDNGISATYGHLSEVKVALYDHVQKGEVIANYQQQFSMVFMQDGKEVSYEKAATQH